MNNEKKQKNRFEQAVIALKKKQNSPLSIGEIVQVFSKESKPIILILLSAPFCQPLQIPGVSTPFGLCIALIGLCLAFGKNIWLPKRVSKKIISPSTLNKILDKTLYILKKMHRWAHPRLRWTCDYPFAKTTNGCTIALLGLFLAMPLPIPFSNLTAAWSIFLISLGTLEDDGLLILSGYTIALFSCVLLILMLFQLKRIF